MIRFNRVLVVALAAALTASLSGCGFQLRGSANLPEDIRVVQLKGGSSLVRDEIEPFLQESGVQVLVQAPAEGEAAPDGVLLLGREEFNRRVLTVNPDTGKAREYEIVYTLAYRFVDAEGAPLVKPGHVRLRRDYVFDADQVIGKSREQRVLYQEMRRDAVQQLLRRLQARLGG